MSAVGLGLGVCALTFLCVLIVASFLSWASVVGAVVGDESTSAGQCGVIAITLWNCAGKFFVALRGGWMCGVGAEGRAIKDNTAVCAPESARIVT